MVHDQKYVLEIIKRLEKEYPDPKTALDYKTPLDLLIATILSAQATDKLVNKVTPNLFKKYRTAQNYADSSVEEIDSYINKVNFHNNKAKSIFHCCTVLVNDFGGNVPEDMEDLIKLPGVARKTANVVLGQAFNKPEGIVVDTHVRRLSQKLGLTKNDDPVKIEQDLMKIVPKEYWITFPLILINFGRDYCPARMHVCKDCPLGDMCPDIIHE